MYQVCPKCLFAQESIGKYTDFSCKNCGHTWNPPINELGVIYYASFDEIDFYLEAPTGEKFNLDFSLKHILIGRNSSFKALHNIEVSREHCEIFIDDVLRIRPLKDNNTRLNDSLLKANEAIPLKPRDVLIISGVPLELKAKLKMDSILTKESSSFKSNIDLSKLESLSYLDKDNESTLLLGNTISPNSICSFDLNKTTRQLSVYAIDKKRVKLNGMPFVEAILEGGEFLNINGSIFAYSKETLSLIQSNAIIGSQLELKNIKASYSNKVILQDISCVFPKGKLIAILGESGCGKSTLIKILSGLKKQDSGSIDINNEDTKYEKWAKSNLFLVPQHDAIHQELTVKKCISYAADIKLSRKTKDYRASIVDRVIRETGLKDFEDKKVETLSGGQRKRVNIAVEIISRPEILVLDEPTSGLDYSTENQIIELLYGLTRQGITVVFVTHSIANLDKVDHIIMLKNSNLGATVFQEGSPSEIKHTLGIDSLNELFGLDRKYSDKVYDSKEDYSFKKNIFDYLHLPPLLSRYIATWSANKTSSIFLLLALPLILGILVRLAVNDAPVGTNHILLGIVAMFWMGINQSVREIVKEREIYIQEESHHTSAFSYLFSKLTFFGIITLPQAILFSLPIVWIGLEGFDLSLEFGRLGDMRPWWVFILSFWAIGFAGSVLGLFFSAISLFFKSKGEVAAILMSIVATLPQILFSERMIENGLTKTAKEAYSFGLFHIDTTPIPEILSYFTFSRYFFISLDSFYRYPAELSNILIFNLSIISIALFVIITITWFILELFSHVNKRD